MNNKRIVFMGTPEFAVASLDALIEAGIEVAAVVTAPDRPAGRGKQLRSSAVKQRALELGLPILQPEKLKDPSFHEQLDRIDASLYVVVAFRMLPQIVWDRPPLGTINLHASLLPAYRGAAPINWAIINGERTTGVTTFRLQQEIDTGDILLQEPIDIGEDETAGELHDRMMVIGAQLLVRTVEACLAGTIDPRPQTMDTEKVPPLAPKIDPTTCRIDPHLPAQNVHDLIRGMSPYPGAWCMLHLGGSGVHFKILRSRISPSIDRAEPGTVRVIDGTFHFACGDGWLEALEVQPEGKRRMQAAEFLRGLRTHDELRLS